MNDLSSLQVKDNISYCQQPLTEQMRTEYQGAVSIILNISHFHNDRINREIEKEKKYYKFRIWSIRNTAYNYLITIKNLRTS